MDNTTTPDSPARKQAHRLANAHLGLLIAVPRLTPSTLTALLLIAETPGITAKEISKKMFHAFKISEMLRRFVQQGGEPLLKLGGQPHEEWRKRPLYLTDRGQKLMADYLSEAFDEPVKVESLWNPDQVERDRRQRDWNEWVKLLDDPAFQKSVAEHAAEDQKRRAERRAARAKERQEEEEKIRRRRLGLRKDGQPYRRTKTRARTAQTKGDSNEKR